MLMKGADFMLKDVNQYNRSIVISSPIDDEVAKEVIEKINESIISILTYLKI